VFGDIGQHPKVTLVTRCAKRCVPAQEIEPRVLRARQGQCAHRGEGDTWFATSVCARWGFTSKVVHIAAVALLSRAYVYHVHGVHMYTMCMVFMTIQVA
jgi:hypothetical protein